MPPPRGSAGIFDLDGTLVQTRSASWDVFQKVSNEFGLGLTGPQEYFALFNGNIFASLEKLCRDRADSEQVRRSFLNRLRREYNPAMVPGMTDVIRRLASQCTLAVLSSNATEVLRRVLVGNGIAYCFAHVFGGDTAPDKAAAIRAFLADSGVRYGRRCEVSYDETPAAVRPNPNTTVLVTDTAGDVRDALAAGIRAVGVAWGMHDSEELAAAGAEFVAIWPQELPGYLLGDNVWSAQGACAAPADVTPGQCGAAAGACSCGCSVPAPPGLTGPVATALAAAATIRRDRRRQAVQAAGPTGSATPVRAAPAHHQAPQNAPGRDRHTAELHDAARRILRPAQRDDGPPWR